METQPYNEMTISTTPFSTKPQHYVSIIMTNWLSKNWWWILIPVVITMSASYFSNAWIYVALMIVLLVYPTLLLNIYFKFALTESARKTVFTQTITFSNKALTRHFIADERYTTVPNDDEISLTDIKQLAINNKEIIVQLKKPSYTYWIIPIDALDNIDVNHIPEIIGINFAL